jgi:sugar lactone lactonase YvrE
MKLTLSVLVFAVVAWSGAPPANGQFPEHASFTTVSITPLAIEGLTGDPDGTFYTTGRATAPARCPVWRIDAGAAAGTLVMPVQIGSIPNAAPGCNPSGITRDAFGSFYIADANQGGVIWRLTAADMNPTSPFATGVPGTNGVAFDRARNLWTGDGTTGLGRVWRISPAGAVTEVFRVQPMRNSTSLGGAIAGDGVGRQVRSFPPGTLTITVPPSATPTVVTPAGGQDLVANGVAFNHEGDLFVADTARGAIWRAQFDEEGNLTSPTGCDVTFAPNTLCLSNVFVAHPMLEGTDGIALDRAGNIWNAANERNAIVVVTKQREVIEIFRNPANAAGLRNSADPSVGNDHILETPTSPFLAGRLFCVANSDGNRRDNSPNSAGEINSGGAVGARGKISCMDQRLQIAGLQLPVR